MSPEPPRRIDGSSPALAPGPFLPRALRGFWQGRPSQPRLGCPGRCQRRLSCLARTDKRHAPSSRTSDASRRVPAGHPRAHFFAPESAFPLPAVFALSCPNIPQPERLRVATPRAAGHRAALACRRRRRRRKAKMPIYSWGWI